MRRLSAIKHGRAYLFAVVAVALIGWGLYASIDALRTPSSFHLRLAAGSSVARRFQVAEALASEGRKRDVYIEVIPTAGFEDSIRQVASGQLDLALVSAGLEIPECKDLRVLAGLDIAPLHILVRRGLAKQDLSLIETLKGRRINLGQPGTNDYMLASDVVRYLRLSPIDSSGHGDYTPSLLTVPELSQLAKDIQAESGAAREATLQKLPDVVMTIASLPGILVQDLLDTDEYVLMPFPNVEPFLISNVQHVRGPEQSVDRLLVEPTTIHKGMYLGNSRANRNDCPTVGLRTVLLARADLSTAAVERVMQSAFETDFLKRVKPQSPRMIATAYKIHPGSEAYLDRDKPFLTGHFFETISKLLSIFGAFSAGALSFYGYLRRRRIRRPGEYLEEIRKIDALASGQQPNSDIPLTAGALAQQLDLRLTQLKEQIISDYCSNRVQGEMVLLSVLSILADSRTQLRASPGRPAGADAMSPARTVATGEAAATASFPAFERKPGRAA